MRNLLLHLKKDAFINTAEKNNDPIFKNGNFNPKKSMKNSKVKKTAQRKAFALVLAIGAMAFMVLLTLTLSAIISSNLRILNAQKQTHEARSHALLGMSIAISNLQRTVGKDNAITVQSSIFDADPETVGIDGVATPYVVGTFNVKKDASGMSPRELQNEQRDLVETIRNGGESPEVSWLISGQTRLRNPISQRPEDLSDETVTLSEYNMLSDYPSKYGGEVSSRLKSDKIEVLSLAPLFAKIIEALEEGLSLHEVHQKYIAENK